MQRLNYTLKLLEPVIISERGANEGGHGSLDYISGASLLGAVANRLYTQLSAKDSYFLFHSGKLRFHNALPLSPHRHPTYPIPFSWHEAKTGTKVVRDDHVCLENLCDLADKTQQPKQLRRGYISFCSEYVSPNKQLQMKTAVDPETGRNKTSALFGYASLPAGLSFGFSLDVDTDIDDALLSKVKNCLQGILHLGRSRSAQYGRVEVSVADWEEDDLLIQEADKGFSIWLLADMALQDSHGQVSFYPEPAHLSFPEAWKASFNLAKSFIRHRSYSPFNGHYRQRELERPVLQMGSMLHFDCENTPSIEDLQQLQQKGLGLYRQAGLGRVWINPPRPYIYKAQKKPPVPAVSMPEHPLAQWLVNQHDKIRKDDEIEKTVKVWLDEYQTYYLKATKLHKIAPGDYAGPGPNQWGRVLEVAQTVSDLSMLKNNLFSGEHAVCKEKDEAWGLAFYAPGDIKNFRAWLKAKVKLCEKENQTPATIAATIARLAHHIRRDIKQIQGNSQ
ncbi:hypothetical protein QUF61_03280 [Candidatus Venteria ishoeyi]|uniref:RAMP superfamily CRISPR-associated protein n=1 Tax=Candidatus Venteria ishoeyi TaxID=1899563 RepID=UPI0025A5BF9E|nr:RAMP superfamily CRISPR-associated protein [Candidatus Venteria ishoeyi]MDM8545496.1 hypothetical protein [Candidatus Venteria ishoeyi]